MKKTLISSLLLANSLVVLAQTETIITPQGNYQITQNAATTYLTGPRALPPMAVPVAVNPITGIGTVIGPKGNYQVIRQGSTTTVIGPAYGGRGK